MKPAILFSSSLLCACVSASGTLRLDFQRNPQVRQAQLQRRDTVTADLGNSLSLGLYSINVSIGTPPQDLTLQIDTGSADLWVPSSSASLCQSDGCPGGSFDSSSSSTFDDVEPGEFNISYVDGSGSSGDYFTDTLEIGGATLESFQMAVADDTTIAYGILGIGYQTSEAAVVYGTAPQYPNLAVAMVDDGLINTEAYSLWLNDLDASTGSILFGGIDTAKYEGDLIAIDIYPANYPNGSQIYTTFTVALTSLTASSSSGSDLLTSSDYAEAVILDSGTTITLLPNSVAALVYEELGATVDRRLGAVVVPCSLAENSGTLDFGFGGSGGPVIKVPMNEIVLPLTLSNGQTPTYNDGSTACQLGMQAAGTLPVLFGDTFLRSAYVVYDLVNNQIGLAQAKMNVSDANVVAFASSGASIPSATFVSGSSVTQTETGIPKATGDSSATVDPASGTLSAEGGFATNSASATASATKKGSASQLHPTGDVHMAWFVGLFLGVGASLVML